MIRNHSEKGFTLVELAIALMVIGLLIGGVLKGQELIDNARVTATMRDLKSYEAAVMIFRNTYNALPGDIKKTNRIPNCTTAICNIPGNGNGRILTNDTTPNNIELYNVYPHLTKAGMVKGPEGGTQAQMNGVITNWETGEPERFFPTMPIDSIRYYGVWYLDTYTVFLPDLSNTTQGPLGHYHLLGAIPFKLAEQMDTKLDDGLPCSGGITIEDTGDCESLGNSYQDQIVREGDGIWVPANF